jgi:glycosyltransferase involved in cell wall biosynthesis
VKISAAIVSYNEVDRIPALMESINGMDEVLFCDDGSTDGTVELATRLGARVVRRSDHSSVVTDKDVEDFFATFNYFPTFAVGDKMFHGSDNRNEAVDLAKNDWIFNPDCDEIVKWDLRKVKKQMEMCDLVQCKIRDEYRTYDCRKLFDRRRFRFAGRIHELPVAIEKGKGRVMDTVDMRIEHRQKPKQHRANYLPVLEYSALHDSDLRSVYYLGREYFGRNDFKKTITTFNIYLRNSTWEPEMADAYLFCAKAFYQLGRLPEANDCCMKAILINPDFREALLTMSILRPEKSHVWKRYAQSAQNTGVLIARM